jgi:hypothetical protein
MENHKKIITVFLGIALTGTAFADVVSLQGGWVNAKSPELSIPLDSLKVGATYKVNCEVDASVSGYMALSGASTTVIKVNNYKGTWNRIYGRIYPVGNGLNSYEAYPVFRNVLWPTLNFKRIYQSPNFSVRVFNCIATRKM